MCLGDGFSSRGSGPRQMSPVSGRRSTEDVMVAIMDTNAVARRTTMAVVASTTMLLDIWCTTATSTAATAMASAT